MPWRSASSRSQFFSGTRRFIGLANYVTIWQDPALWRVVTNTMVWTIGSVVGQLSLGLVAAVALNASLPGMRLVRGLLLIPYVVPVIAVALVWRWMLDGSFGIVSVALQGMGLLVRDQTPLGVPGGAMIAVIIANVWRGFPFAMLVYWAALQSIDPEQYDAAQVDGAGLAQQFWQITLPHLRNATLVLLVLRGIWTITYFDLIWLITRGGPGGSTEHWPIWIYQQAMGSFNFPYASAVATVLGLVLLVFAVGYVRMTRFGGT